ncbi:MAG: hemerythrin domain-containing protein [Proteobacteria bacterium]|nr:hemerythrin domain-containing protein [Pseudomonadota bacterium]
MLRDPRLIELSREHHIALRLAKRLAGAGTADGLPAVTSFLRQEKPTLLRHFGDEERDLLPQLREFGEVALAERLVKEHRDMEDLMTRDQDPAALTSLGRMLADHVRFEERELFEVLQKHWAARA